jgi:ABC-type glycerol-3-phosphate transport system substrate-binding protein
MRIFVFLLISIALMSGSLHAQTPSPPDAVIFWHHYADERRADFWQMIADEYNESHPENMPVQVAYFPSYDHQHDAILAGLLNGNLPDVALVRGYDAALYQLGDALADAGQPLTQSATALYVNMDALASMGFDEPPTTRAEFAVMACAFHNGRGWGDVQLLAPAGFDFPRDASFLVALASHQGLEFDNDLWGQTFAFLLDLQSQACMSTTTQTRVEMQNRFASGQTAFYVDSSSARPFVEAAIGNYFAQPFALEVVPIPGMDGPVSHWSGPSLSIFRSSPEKESAAQQWVSWLAQPEQVARWADVNQSYSEPEDHQPFVDAMPLTEPNFAGYDLIRDEIIFAALDILAGQSPASRLESLTATANEIKEAFQSP